MTEKVSNINQTSAAPGRRLLTEKDVAEMLGVTDRTLQNWRIRGYGPKFRKIGYFVRYDLDEVNAFIDAGAHQSTSEYGRGAALRG